jgi:hypothetical protein
MRAEARLYEYEHAVGLLVFGTVPSSAEAVFQFPFGAQHLNVKAQALEVDKTHSLELVIAAIPSICRT